MISVAITILGMRVDARLLHAPSHLGRSLTYFRLDFGCRTLLQWDVELVSREVRGRSAVEYLVRFGPWQNTNRSYYVA